MYPWPGIADQAGRIVDLGVAPVPPYAQVLVRANLATAAADTFPLPSYDGGSFQLLNPAGRPIRSLSIPFAGRLVWRLDPRGYVWSAITDEYRIVQQRLPGDTVLIIELARAPAPVSAEERATALEGLADFEVAGGRVDRSQIPSTKPQFHDFMVDDRGYLWVATAGGLDVFGPDGRYLGVVTGSNLIMWPARPVFRGAYVYGFTLDELHVAYLVRLRVEGRG
jgi:hypothetical protein